MPGNSLSSPMLGFMLVCTANLLPLFERNIASHWTAREQFPKRIFTNVSSGTVWRVTAWKQWYITGQYIISHQCPSVTLKWRKMLQNISNYRVVNLCPNLEFSIFGRSNLEFLSQIVDFPNLEFPNLNFSIFGKLNLEFSNLELPNLEFSIFARSNLEFPNLEF